MTFSLQPTQCFKLPFAWEPVRSDMAADRVGQTRADEVHSSDLETSREHGVNLQKRQARVTVKYNRKELQRRLDVEKWIDDCLDELYLGKEDDMPDEVNIDHLLDLASNEERVKKLKEILQTCSNNTEAFIGELLVKLEGLHKQEELATEGIEHPSHYNHAQHRHEPYHFNRSHWPRTHTHQTP
ncbi:protein phosphatase 1 regulatory subunit 14A [Salmo salar]|uniref:Protein phosphatase 1 regulatory subunit 14A n=1 Tax=Salmo salar TaxID=8030 RepID=A0ABM3CSA7_SALSA|nr:protein phosphatase 1 regulatory subunit 14A [Salmo salar]